MRRRSIPKRSASNRGPMSLDANVAGDMGPLGSLKMQFEPVHLNVFLRIPTREQGKIGSKLREWAESLEPKPGSDITSQLPCEAMCRRRLRALCATADPATAFLAVMAWGGMHRLHAARAWAARDAWLPAVSQIRDAGRTRVEDFAAMHELRMAGRLPGVGTAYFTKLLFFMRPEPNAYILDQWTAKSVNVLTGREVVKVSRSGWVVPGNDSGRYEEFCAIVDHLAERLGCVGEEAEHALVSKGGRKPWEWRAHVKANWVPTAPGRRR